MEIGASETLAISQVDLQELIIGSRPRSTGNILCSLAGLVTKHHNLRW